MTFTSLLFALFAGGTIFIYYLKPLRKYQWQILLIASYFFYAYNSFKYTAFILFTTLSIYAAAVSIDRINADARRKSKAMKGIWNSDEKRAFKNTAEKKKKKILAISLFFNFGILFVIKYLDFFVGGIMHMIKHVQPHGQILNLLLPLGISFYTFQATGYLIDVYRGTISAEKSLPKFALFVSFFPQIIQGPISSFENLETQLYIEHKPKWFRFKSGGMLILWGLFKKLVVADCMYNVITTIAEYYREYVGGAILLAALMYALQLYADFSGGIDIARGVACILGIDIENNFRQPYFSQTISEYWRRWHITLGAWMKKYVFYSLAVSQIFLNAGRRIARSDFGKTAAGKHVSKTLPSAFASFIVFMLIGIWHGANSKYIGFGMWNGLIIMSSTLLAPVYSWIVYKLHIKTEAGWWQLFRMIRTFLIVLVGYYFDIATSLRAAIDMMFRSVADIRIITALHQVHDAGFHKSDALVVFYGMLTMLYFSIRLERTGLETPGDLLNRRPAWLQWIVIFAGVMSILVFGQYGSGSEGTDFVYMGF